MKTDVWMPLYIGEYLADTMHLSTTEHGAYLLLIMAYWRLKAPLPDEDHELAAIARVSQSDWSAMRLRLAKFFQVGAGVWRHKRVDFELASAQGRKEAKSKAGKAGNEARWGKKSQRDDSANRNEVAEGIAKDRSSPSPSPLISREREPVVVERPSLQEVLCYAQTIGLAEWKARDWFQEMEGGGWLDHNHRPVVKWRAVLDRVRTKWEADGRPTQPPSRPRSPPVRRPGPEPNQTQERLEIPRL